MQNYEIEYSDTTNIPIHITQLTAIHMTTYMSDTATTLNTTFSKFMYAQRNISKIQKRDIMLRKLLENNNCENTYSKRHITERLTKRRTYAQISKWTTDISKIRKRVMMRSTFLKMTNCETTYPKKHITEL